MNRTVKLIFKLIYISLFSILIGCATSLHDNLALQKQNAHNMAIYHIQQSAITKEKYQANQHLINAADYFIQASAYLEAYKLLENLYKPGLNHVQIEHSNILLAEIALAEQNLVQAERLLNNIWTPNKLSTTMQIKFYRTRSNTLLRLGNVFSAVQDRIALARLLTDSVELKENNLAIWHDLMQLTPNALHDLSDHDNSTVLNGWLKLAYINKQYDSTTDQKNRALTLWRQEYLNHPAEHIPSIQPATSNHNIASNVSHREQNISSSKIGLLLPLTGVHANSAKAVKDGFITAFYQDNSNHKKAAYEIKIYDTNPNNVLDAYKKAKGDGVGFIVGPLTKQEVEAIASVHNLTIPVLALNTVNQLKHTPKKLYQFGLPPEHQAKTIALKAQQNAYKNAAAIVPNTAWGQRMLQAFILEWHAMGGNIVTSLKISNNTDVDKAIQKLLQINKSNNSAVTVSESTRKAKFTPHRTTNLDFIFLATDYSIAKQIKPLLNFYFAANIPIYASSNVYSTNNNAYDTDLDDIFFCDMPWILDPSVKLRNNYKTIIKLSPSDFEDSARLYALGLDAYKIVKEFDQLEQQRGLVISGMTGMLSLTKDNTIDQKLIWAKIKNGKAVLENWNDTIKEQDR
jgi:outer membrane PBP1 activator LpoA protein